MDFRKDVLVPLNFLNVLVIGQRVTRTKPAVEQMQFIWTSPKHNFDSVPHQRLIYKFQQLGIRGNLLQWIKAFLIGRRQRVILRNGASSWRDVISGVPQGTILGPMFFLLFVNDMPDVVSSTAKMSADYTKLYRNIYSTNDCKVLQEDLNALSAWSHHWLLRSNASKCVTVRFRFAFHYVFSLNGIYLEEASEQKDLGVLISNNLKPSRHICNVL